MNIPTEEEFARAKARARERERGLEEVSETVRERFGDIAPLVVFSILPQGDNGFWVGIFYRSNSDVSRHAVDGMTQSIQDCVYDELQRVGRGYRDQIEVIFEVDSDERVQLEFGGDYFLRMR